MRHGLAEEEQIEGHQIALADELALPLVATNDAYFLRAETYDAHDALLCVAQNSHVEDENRRRLTQEHWFLPADEMRRRSQTTCRRPWTTAWSSPGAAPSWRRCGSRSCRSSPPPAM